MIQFYPIGGKKNIPLSSVDKLWKACEPIFLPQLHPGHQLCACEQAQVSHWIEMNEQTILSYLAKECHFL